MKIIKLFYDLETTGLSVEHGIHQMSGALEVDGEIVKEFDFRIKPYDGCLWSEQALIKCNVERKDLEECPLTEQDVHRKIKNLLAPYIDRFDRTQKAFLVGYNNAGFDDDHLRALFERQDDPYFGAWFWADPLDVRVLAAEYLQTRRASMGNFQLSTVAKELGLQVDSDRLHEAGYDIYLTRSVYRIVTGITLEI